MYSVYMPLMQKLSRLSPFQQSLQLARSKVPLENKSDRQQSTAWSLRLFGLLGSLGSHICLVHFVFVVEIGRALYEEDPFFA